MVSTGDTLLVADNVQKRFGGILALSNYSITIRRGELLGLIGPNGAGKTTVFNVLSGVLPLTKGTILFEGRDISSLGADKTARAGIARTFQNIRLFEEMSVLDNIRTGFHHHMGSGLFSTLMHLSGFRLSENEMGGMACDLAEMVGVEQHLNSRAGDLPYGDQRRLEIARALALKPKLLLLDEPAAGMNPQETDDLIATIRRIHEEFDLSILIVEHDMHLVMNLCQRLQVINYGQLLAEGLPEEMQNNPEVVEAYLGSSAGAEVCGA